MSARGGVPSVILPHLSDRRGCEDDPDKPQPELRQVILAALILQPSNLRCGDYSNPEVSYVEPNVDLTAGIRSVFGRHSFFPDGGAESDSATRGCGRRPDTTVQNHRRRANHPRDQLQATKRRH